MDGTPKERRRYPRGRLRKLSDALYRELRFIGRHIRGFYAAVAVYLTVGFAVGAALGVLFTAFGHLVMTGATQAFDEWVLRRVAEIRTPWLDAFMLEVTALGNAMVLAVMVSVASVFLWLTRHRLSVFLLLVAVLGGWLLNALLKDFYERPRPLVIQWRTRVGTHSFPSGHAMTALIAYGSIAYLVGRLEPTRTLRRATWTVAILVIVLIGISRIYLGVHYPSDVIAGYVAGLAWLVFVAAGVTAIRFFAERKPAVRELERGLDLEEERRAGPRL